MVETSVEVEQRKIKAFNLVKDTIEDEDGNIIKLCIQQMMNIIISQGKMM
ncbi:hypothetical protein [Lachnobacterium bovis]|nr:hypothetical protein [Lachnobacterium bovis]